MRTKHLLSEDRDEALMFFVRLKMTLKLLLTVRMTQFLLIDMRKVSNKTKHGDT